MEEKGRGWLAARRSSSALGEEGGEADFVEEEVDEGEMRRVVMGRVGGWVDWMVGWMDLRGEGEGGGEEEGEGNGRGGKRGRREMGGKDIVGGEVEVEVGEDGIEAAPGNGEGLLGDARWLVGVMGKVVL